MEIKKVKLKRDYNDTGYTGRFVKSGSTGQAYLWGLDLGEDRTLWKVQIDNYSLGEITIRQCNLEFM